MDAATAGACVVLGGAVLLDWAGLGWAGVGEVRHEA